MTSGIRIHSRVILKRPYLTEDDVEVAWRNAIAARRRDGEDSDSIAAAGADNKGRILEMLGTELDDGSVLIFHAMPITKKMMIELGLTQEGC